MPKNFVLCLCLVALFQLTLTPVRSQSVIAPLDADASPVERSHFAIDDPRTLLMVRGALIALNQANQTGNYSVLRDLGTPNFLITNNSARLAETFRKLRTEKIDLAPVLLVNPKFISPPAMQDGDVFRVTGYFPTAPEQVNFDIAFQISKDRWSLAAIAVNVSPPGETLQAFSSSGALREHSADNGEERPIRIDLSQSVQAPVPPPVQPVAKKASPKKLKAPVQRAYATPQAQTSQAVTQTETAPFQAAPTQPSSADSDSQWNPFGH